VAFFWPRNDSSADAKPLFKLHQYRHQFRPVLNNEDRIELSVEAMGWWSKQTRCHRLWGRVVCSIEGRPRSESIRDPITCSGWL